MKKENHKNMIISGLIVLVILLVATNLLTLNYSKNLLDDKVKNNNNNKLVNNKDSVNNNEDKITKDEEISDKTIIENDILPSCEKDNSDFSVNTKNEVVSISTFTYDEVISIPNVKTYNVYSNQIISSSELLKIFKITNSEFQKQLKSQYLSFFDRDNTKYINGLNEYSKIDSNFDVSAELKNISDVRTQIEKTDYNALDYNMYINFDGNIEFIMDNELWVKKRGLVSWREIGSEDYTKIVIK